MKILSVLAVLLFLSILPILAQKAKITERTAVQVFEHHKDAFLSRDIDRILKDYSEKSTLITPNSKMHKGLNEIRKAFEHALRTMFAKVTEMDIVQQVNGDGIVYVVYIAKNRATGKTYLPYASDTFIVKNGKILYQTAANGKIPQ